MHWRKQMLEAFRSAYIICCLTLKWTQDPVRTDGGYWRHFLSSEAWRRNFTQKTEIWRALVVFQLWVRRRVVVYPIGGGNSNLLVRFEGFMPPHLKIRNSSPVCWVPNYDTSKKQYKNSNWTSLWVYYDLSNTIRDWRALITLRYLVSCLKAARIVKSAIKAPLTMAQLKNWQNWQLTPTVLCNAFMNLNCSLCLSFSERQGFLPSLSCLWSRVTHSNPCAARLPSNAPNSIC